MTVPAVETPHASYLEDFEAFQREAAEAPPFLAELRRRAIARFGELGFPTTRQEDWRFTNVTPVVRTAFERSRPGLASVASEALAAHTFGSPHRLVFVDGFFAPELSTLGALPDGVTIDSLAHALAAAPERVERHLGRHASFAEHPFVALSTAFVADGAFIELPKGAAVEEPIHLLYLASGSTGADGKPLALYPRNLIVAGESSQATVIETYAGLGSGVSLSCATTELVAAPNASVHHYKVQQESTEAFHFGTLQMVLGRSSNVFSHSIATGGRLVRNDTNALLDDEGSECHMDGLYVLRGEQFIDNHMYINHAKPNCYSFELFKGILDGRSRALFNGRIYVAQDAQKTNAEQSSRNLLLSAEAQANSNPQLEIFADDVRCTHGSTVGQLDDDAVFYLRSRGIGEEAARSLLTYAFASDIVNRIEIEPVRRELEEFLFSRLPKGEIVRQAV